MGVKCKLLETGLDVFFFPDLLTCDLKVSSVLPGPGGSPGGDPLAASPLPADTHCRRSAAACSVCTRSSLACSSFFTSLSSKVAALKWRRLCPVSALAAAIWKEDTSLSRGQGRSSVPFALACPDVHQGSPAPTVTHALMTPLCLGLVQ